MFKNITYTSIYLYRGRNIKKRIPFKNSFKKVKIVNSYNIFNEIFEEKLDNHTQININCFKEMQAITKKVDKQVNELVLCKKEIKDLQKALDYNDYFLRNDVKTIIDYYLIDRRRKILKIFFYILLTIIFIIIMFFLKKLYNLI